jgi:hypothetical protein
VTTRRLALVGAAALALGLGLVGCGTDSGTDTPAAAEQTTPADPKMALVSSVKEIDKGNFKFTMTGDGLTGTGQVHQPSRSAQMDLKVEAEGFSMGINLVFIEPDSYVKLDLGDLGDLAGVPGMAELASGKWMHLDQSKVKGLDELSVDFNDIDPAGAEKILAGIGTVEKTGDGVYKGTIDVSKVKGSDMFDDELIKTLGGTATVPFEAKVDGEGRLTSLTIDVPAAGDTRAHKLQITYDYSSAAATQKPPAKDVVEAPAEAYEIFS